MTAAKPGLLITPPDGTIKIEDGASNFLKALVDGAAALFGNPVSAFTGTKSLIDVARAIKFEDTPGKDSYKAILLSFAWAFDQIAQETDAGYLDRKAHVRAIVDLAHKEVKKLSHVIDETFLSQPTANTLYIVLRDYVIDHLDAITHGVVHDRNVLSRRIDANFARAIAEIFLQRSELFSAISTAVDFLRKSPSAIYRDWDHLHSLWRYDFRSTILFGQEATKISVSELYVPLRARPSQTLAQTSGVSDEELEVSIESSSFFLVDHAEAWVNAGEGQVLLVGGGPGSGKSTSLRALADQLTGDELLRVVYIPLQRLNLQNDLKAEIERIISERTGGFREFPVLSRESLSSTSKLVLIFDGLDEIAKPGDQADQITQQFVIKLNLLISLLQSREGCPRLRCIVSGRVPAFQAARRCMDLPQDNCLEVLGFLPASQDDAASDIDKRDQREDWWQMYAKLFGAGDKPIPIFMSAAWTEITNEPLLCYLLGLSGYLDPNRSHDIISTNQIFSSLVDQVWVRGWAGSDGPGRSAPGRLLSQKDFNDLMEAFALAAWHGGDTRSASEEGFEKTVQTVRRQDTWKRFKQDNGEGVTNLAMNFYFRSSEEGARGFEFTHKSFGDYLAARCLFKLAIEVSEYSDRKIDLAISDWFSVSSRCVFTREIFEFLTNEVHLYSIDSGNIDCLKSVLRRFEAIAAHVATDGFDISNADDSVQLYALHRQAELAAHAIRSATFHAIRRSTGEILKFGLPDELPIDFPSIIFRLCTSHLAVMGFSEAKLFPGIDSPDSNFFGPCLYGADLSFSNLRNCNFSWGTLNSCNLSYCDFSESRFLRTNLLSCNFEGSKLDRSYFDFAQLERSNIFKSTKGKISMNSATLALMDQTTFAELAGSTRLMRRVLPRSWERGASTPQAMVNRMRLMDTIESEIEERKKKRRSQRKDGSLSPASTDLR